MEVNQSEFGIVKALLEKLPVCFFPDAFLHRSVFDEFHISDQRDTISTKEVANTRFGIRFKMSSLSVNGGTFGCYEVDIGKPIRLVNGQHAGAGITLFIHGS